jgi:hypothetical protein
VEQFQSNLAATNLVWQNAITEELHQVGEEPRKYWSTRAKLPWN